TDHPTTRQIMVVKMLQSSQGELRNI
ncbi:uncharacterized protein METZ01_LOCUS508491, partial [marine metagenome]